MNAKIIVITGTTRGLGRAMTTEFIRLGHTVAGCGRCREIVAELGRRHPPPHRFEAVDVADDAQVAAWAQSCLEALGPPDLLLNNAAVVNRNAPLWMFDAEEFDRVIDVNIKGAVNVIRHFLPAMLARRAGVVVNFSSGWGRSTAPEVAPYCASKWALEGLSKSLAQELPPGMAAIPISPGIIDTDMLRTSFGAAAANYPGPEEWARTAVPWLLKLGPRDNGRSLSIDG
jgi:NAD(P)-dependent dehydrogenase (short-subunit alcohol dehydrogenase family)